MKYVKSFVHLFCFPASFVAAGLLIGCGSVQVAKQIPTVGFHGVGFANVEIAADQYLKMDFLLHFKITNPYDVPVTVPAHQVQLKLEDRALSGLTASVEQLTVAPHDSGIETYLFHFDLSANELRNYLGRDVSYTLMAQVRPLSFANVTLVMEHTDSIRLPLPPKLTYVPNQMAELSFLGDHAVNTVDLTPIRDGMKKFASGLLEPDSIPDLGLVTVAVKKAAETLTSHLPGWNEFKTQWEQFRTANLKFTSINSSLEGIQVTVPFRVTNPNDFLIEVPVFACGLGNQNASPFTSTKIIPRDVASSSNLPEAEARKVERHASKDMNLVVTLRWADLGNPSQRMDLLELMRPGGWEKNLQFTGETFFDLGYGPTRIRLNLPVTLKKF